MQAASNILHTLTPDTIEYVWRTIVEAIHPVNVVLFGSWAFGTADNERDRDLNEIISPMNEQETILRGDDQCT